MTRTHRPPRLANWLLNLFVSRHQLSPILGDLQEEFSDVASQAGMRYARLWYWRQAMKTVPHLFLAQLAIEPWQSCGALLSGLLALTLAYVPLYILPFLHLHGDSAWVRPLGLLAQLPSTDWPQSFRGAWQEGVSNLHLLLPPMLVGWALAQFNQRRDAALTIAITFATIVLGIAGFLADKQLVTTPSSAWSLVWLAHTDAMLVCPVAIFIEGMLERLTAPRGFV